MGSQKVQTLYWSYLPVNYHSSYQYDRHSAFLYCLIQFCTAVWLHNKLHLVLPQARTESLGRISVGFWCITTSRDGVGRIQTGRGFLALLSTLMGSLTPTREASPPCSQWRNTTAPHYITLAKAQKGDVHSHVPDMINSCSRDKVMIGQTFSFTIADHRW